jgi:hypothetical protein
MVSARSVRAKIQIINALPGAELHITGASDKSKPLTGNGIAATVSPNGLFATPRDENLRDLVRVELQRAGNVADLQALARKPEDFAFDASWVIRRILLGAAIVFEGVSGHW